MSQSYEPHRLVIQHLAVLESAPAVVSEVEQRVFGAIDEKIKEWVESQGDWEGVFDYLDEETTFKPLSWEKNENGNYLAYYTLDCETDDGYAHTLSPLLGVTPTNFGILFSLMTSWITGMSGKGAKPGAAWKKYLAEQFSKTKLPELHFELHGEDLFLPIRIDAQVLAEGYPDSLGDALTPIDEALERLEAAHPEIDALLKAAQEYHNSIQAA